MARLYLHWPDSLWKRLTVDGVVRADAPIEWPREPCWIWTGGCNGPWKHVHSGGYGYLRTSRTKVERVHLLAYRELRGPMPEGLIPRHTCDVRRCCNPWHMIPGTKSENTIDAWMRTRGSKRTAAATP